MRGGLTDPEVERVARALCLQSGDDPDKLTYAHAMSCTGRDATPKHCWMYWIPFAQVALTAIKGQKS